jgi:hypothetical protein
MHADSAKEIALDLGISPKTVASHLGSLYLKCGVSSVAGLIRLASRNYAEHAPGCDCQYCQLMELEIPEYCTCIHCTSMRGTPIRATSIRGAA